MDRIVLNGYFRPGRNAGGFLVWWLNLTGSTETFDNTHLMRLAGGLSRRIRGWAKAKGFPVIHCKAGGRKPDRMEEYLQRTPIARRVFLTLVRKAQAPVWGVSVSEKQLPGTKEVDALCCFHVLDPDRGHVTFKINGHPPFPAQIIFNGHESVACQQI